MSFANLFLLPYEIMKANRIQKGSLFVGSDKTIAPGNRIANFGRSIAKPLASIEFNFEFSFTLSF